MSASRPDAGFPGPDGADPRRPDPSGRRVPALFLDRDGVIVRNRPDYVRSLDQIVFIPGALEAIRRLSRGPALIIVITNQSAVGRGIITRRQADRINDTVLGRIRTRGGRVDALYMCPHHPDRGCPCRKPSPGMILEAANEHDIDLSRSYVVGDGPCDIRAGRGAGARPLLVLTGRTSARAAARMPGLTRATPGVFGSLAETVPFLLDAYGAG